MVDIVGDPDVLEVRPILLPPLTEVDIQVVQRDGWVTPASPSHQPCAATGLPQDVQPVEGTCETDELNKLPI